MLTGLPSVLNEELQDMQRQPRQMDEAVAELVRAKICSGRILGQGVEADHHNLDPQTAKNK